MTMSVAPAAVTLATRFTMRPMDETTRSQASIWSRLLSGFRHPVSILLALSLLGGGVRLFVMEQTFPVDLTGDEDYYAAVAVNIAAGRGHTYEAASRAFRPPAHPFLLSLVAPDTPSASGEIDDRTLRRFLLVQVALGSVLVLLTGLLGRSLFDARTGVLAAAIVALYPSAIAFSHYLWSEVLFTVLIAGAIVLALRMERSTSPLWPVLAGAVFGAATLCREIALVVAGGFALWRVWCASPGARKQAWSGGALMLVVAVLVVLPWTIRNYRILERVVPVSTIGTFALREGNTFGQGSWLAPDMESLWRFRDLYFSIDDETRRMDVAGDQAHDLILREQPTWIFKKLVRTFSGLLTPDSYLFKKVSRGNYGEVDLRLFRPVLAITVTAFLLVTIAGALGVSNSEKGGRRLLACVLLGAVFAVHLVSNSASRFRLPWMPLVIVYASHAIVSRRDLWPCLRGVRRNAATVFILLVLFGCVPFFFADAISLWTVGSYVDPMRQ